MSEAAHSLALAFPAFWQAAHAGHLDRAALLELPSASLFSGAVVPAVPVV